MAGYSRVNVSGHVGGVNDDDNNTPFLNKA